MPHVVASALAGTTPEQYLTLTAGGWLDTTRIAAADGPLWTQIFAHNRRAVADGIGQVEQSLAAFRRAIEAEDAAAIERADRAMYRAKSEGRNRTVAH